MTSDAEMIQLYAEAGAEGDIILEHSYIKIGRMMPEFNIDELINIVKVAYAEKGKL